MMCGAFAYALLVLAMSAPAQSANAIDKVMTMLSDLVVKVEAQEQAAKTTFEKFSSSCKAQSAQYGFEIKTSKAEIEELTATISKETATISKASAEIEELSASISSAESDLAAAKKVRALEASAYAKEEAELLETCDTIERAISVLSKAGASMLQTKNAGTLVQALTVMVQASMLTQADASRLTALTQTFQQTADSEADDDMMPGAPAAEAYEGHSGGIIETLQSLQEKAQSQLDSARKTETTSIHNYEMLEQSLSDEIKYAAEDMDKTKLTKLKATEAKGLALGDLSVTKKDLADTEAMLSELEHDCLAAAEDYEEAQKNRLEELTTIRTAIAHLEDAMKGASFLNKDMKAMSLVQVKNMKTTSGTDLADIKAVRFVRNLARTQGSGALAQLAAQMDSAMSMGDISGEDVFGKVKALVMEMIERLEAQATAEENHKAYCDKQLAETKAKKEASTSEVKSFTVELDQSKAHAATLREQVAELQKELAASSKAVAEAGTIRNEEHAEFVKVQVELKTGVAGVQLALKVLQEYYAKGEASEETTGFAGGVLALLETIESDLSKSLVEAEQAEETAATEYEKMVFAIKVSTATKEQDVKYKTKEAAALDKKISELETDLDNAQTLLSATTEDLEKLTESCTFKVVPYEERVARRAAEINGLKEALNILEGETVLLQQKVKRRALRGVQAHKN